MCRRVNIADLRWLSLERPAYKVKPWLAFGNLDFRMILTIYQTKSGSRCLKCSNKQYILCWKCFVFFWEPGILVHASQGALVVKNPPASAGDIRAMGLIPGSGRVPGEGHGRLQFVGSQRIRHDWSDLAHTQSSRQRMPKWLVLSKNPSCMCACVLSSSVVSDSLWPHGLWPTRLLCPWNFPGKNTGVCCHFLLQGLLLFSH